MTKTNQAQVETTISRLLSKPQENWLLEKLADVVMAERFRPTCLNCENFNEPAELCRLAGQRPPARVIVTGCPKFSELIPF